MLKRFALFSTLIASSANADPSTINNVNVKQTDRGFTFSVTVTHNDTGWDHYVNGWRIIDSDGAVLGVRELAHPHVNEQPFTRSLSGVRIPGDLREVYVETRDSTTGWDNNAIRVTLP